MRTKNSGGAWIIVVNGFASIKERDGDLICEPSLSDKWKEIHVRKQIIYDRIKYVSVVVTVL